MADEESASNSKKDAETAKEKGEPEKPQKRKLGLQADGSVLVDAQKDFSIHLFNSLECWKRPVKTWTSDV